MIIGKHLTDSDIHIDFDSKKVEIDYGIWYVENESEEYSKLFHYTSFLFLFIPYSIFIIIHSFIIIPSAPKFKNFDTNRYLNFLNSFHRMVFGKKITEFWGELGSTQIVVHSPYNLEFKYTLTGDYEKFCKSITLEPDMYEVKWRGRSYGRFGGFYFTISFSEIPKNGTAVIEYY